MLYPSSADLTLAGKVGIGAKVSYKDGFKRTIDWYFMHRDVGTVKANLEKALVER